MTELNWTEGICGGKWNFKKSSETNICNFSCQERSSFKAEEHIDSHYFKKFASGICVTFPDKNEETQLS